MGFLMILPLSSAIGALMSRISRLRTLHMGQIQFPGPCELKGLPHFKQASPGFATYTVSSFASRSSRTLFFCQRSFSAASAKEARMDPLTAFSSPGARNSLGRSS